MTKVELFTVSKKGFHKTITATLGDGGLAISSYAFDTEGYDREFDLAVAAEHLVALASKLGVKRFSDKRLMTALQKRFRTSSADSDIERFLKDANIPVTGRGYTSFP